MAPRWLKWRHWGALMAKGALKRPLFAKGARRPLRCPASGIARRGHYLQEPGRYFEGIGFVEPGPHLKAATTTAPPAE